jgi:hypothetical protein
MNRSLKQIKLVDGQSKYVSRIEGDACQPNTIGAKFLQLQLLDQLAHTPGMIDCGNLPYQTMKMFHDGEKWVVELEAIGE